MDNLTHSLVGAVLGQTGLKKKTGLAMPALIIGANLPDIDAACFFWLEGTEHLGFRRGITHGPPAMVLLPLILAGALWWYDRWQTKRGKRPEDRLPVHFGWLFGLSLLGCLSHPAMDWLNVYGIRLLEPFSSQWFYGDTLFIIDVWLWALLGGTLWWSLRKEKRGSNWVRPAWLGGTAALAYIALNGAISVGASHYHHEYQDVAETIASPVAFAFWERELVVHNANSGSVGTTALIGRWSAFDGADEFQSLPATSFALIEEAGAAIVSMDAMAAKDHQLGAFLFWSRAPFAVCSVNGTVVLYDARFYDPRARDRFSVALPGAKCETLPDGSETAN